MPLSVPLRLIGRLILAVLAVVGLAGLFLTLIVLTDGARAGLAAWLTALGAGVIAALWRGRGRTWPGRLWPFAPVIVAAALTASVCIPTAPTTRQYPPDLPFVATRHWSLSTGSRVAVYHYPPAAGAPGIPRRSCTSTEGPSATSPCSTTDSCDSWPDRATTCTPTSSPAADEATCCPMEQYTISRSVRDLAAFIDRLDKGPVDVLGFSAARVVLTRALATPDVAARVHRAIIAEPGPMDGPTAR